MSDSKVKVHPATRVWWTQRRTCMKCNHVDKSVGKAGEQIMRCKVSSTQKDRKGALSRGHYCIDARDTDGACGPHARLYKPKPVKE